MNHCYKDKCGMNRTSAICDCTCEDCQESSTGPEVGREVTVKTPVIQRFQLRLPDGVQSGMVHYPTSDEMAEKMNEIIDWINRQ